MRRPHMIRIALLAAIAAIVLTAPAASQAALYCVEKSPCLAGTPVADPQAGLMLAELNPGPDTVSIGGRTAPYVGPFSYSAADPVTIVGSGTGAGGTTLTAPAGQLTLALDHANSVVSDLRIESATGPSIGLELEGTATGVRIEESDVAGAKGAATGALLLGGAEIERSTVAMKEGLGIVASDPSFSASVRESTIRSRAGDGILARGSLSVRRSTVESFGVGIESGGQDGDLDVSDTVVRTVDGAALKATYGGTVAARHLTLLNDGSAPRGIEVLAGAAGTGGPTSLTLASSIVSGYSTSLNRQGFDASLAASVVLRYSAWDGGIDDFGAGVLDITTGNLPGTTPAFVQRVSAPPTIEANLRPLAPSPLIDAAAPPVPPAPGIDRDGTPRGQDGDGDGVGRSDIGAFEYVPHGPTGAAIAPLAGAAAGVPVQFSAGAQDPDPGEQPQLVYSWDFGDGGTATGATATHTFAAPGIRTVSVVVTDPSRRSTVATTGVEVAPGPPTDQGPGPSPGGPRFGSADKLADTDAPRLSGVSLSTRRFRLGGLLPQLVRRVSGSQVRFRLSEPARVTLRFSPARGSAPKRRPPALVVDGTTGLNRLRFAGRLSPRRALPTGAYSVSFSAADAAGNRSRERIVRRFELVR